MNTDLFLAILAMDVYHRGYNAGLERDNLASRAKVEGTNLGLAEVGVSKGDQVAQDIGFYAQAYTLGSETIIAYRGTDRGFTDFSATGDIQNGYVLAAGLPDASQALAAAEFFAQGQGGKSASNANAIVTGQSLGGGLAGFIAKLYNVDASIFNHMAFELGSDFLYEVASGNTNAQALLAMLEATGLAFSTPIWNLVGMAARRAERNRW